MSISREATVSWLLLCKQPAHEKGLFAGAVAHQQRHVNQISAAGKQNAVQIACC